jgi:FlaG/FlaF family flagellin (archaellin)
MVYKCKNCGAKLNVDKDAEMVTCEYCDSVNKIEKSTFDFYNNWTQNWSQNTKKYTKLSIFITIGMVVLGIVMSVLMNPNTGVLNNNENKDEFSSEDRDDYYYGTYRYNYYQDGGLLVNCNNDAFLDIVSIALDIETSTHYIHIIDGETGERIAEKQINYDNGPKLFVVNQNFVFTAKEDFTISIYNREDLSLLRNYSLKR